METKSVGITYWTRKGNLGVVPFLVILIALVIGSCGGGGGGTCVGSGGSILDAPVCKDDWTRGECGEWDELEVNDADWDFNAGGSCTASGFTELCSDGSYRLPGDC